MQNLLTIFAYCIYLLSTLVLAAKIQDFLYTQNFLHKMAIPKTEGRDEFRDVLNPIMAELKKGHRDYSREAAILTPEIDRVKLQQAVNGRTVYWPAVAALKKVLEQRKKAPVAA